jgi:catechol 2,3-dioxygenase-like lactoylglutathione lyase family enzyme
MQLGTSVSQLRPFLPARDFAISREFYRMLGFHETWSSDRLAILELGRFSFFLQNYFVKEWADNMVMALDVADVDACWARLRSLNLSTRFPNVVSVGAPVDDVNAGVRRGHFVDPSGVLWHFSQPLR